MYKYLFTNDLRISELKTALNEAVQAVVRPDLWNDKSTGNNTSTLAFYFNLYKGSECLKVAEESIEKVIQNFVTKFQFPNTRTQESLKDVVSGNYRIAPLRELINILFFQCLKNNSRSSFITKDEFLYFILCHPEYYSGEHTDYNTIVEKI